MPNQTLGYSSPLRRFVSAIHVETNYVLLAQEALLVSPLSFCFNKAVIHNR